MFLFVGRFDVVKRVDLFIEACARVHRAGQGNMRFLIAGQGMESQNRDLTAMLRRSGVADRFELLGHVCDPQMLYSAADCLIVTSESEGSPNVVYEAIATRLQSVILATPGTETISGFGVLRLPTRSIEALTDAMTRLGALGIPDSATRWPSEAARAVAEHPLVTFYKSMLPAV
jgi:glycosyltransferase involved in cell wall biosynthesis